jgi:pSer/pThr/pTyr-binding forkhead associated (FHA) protein
VQHLPVPLRAESARPRDRAATVPPEWRPTHVVHASRAYRIGPRPITLGSAVPGDRRALAVEAGPGVSRSHCTFLVEAGTAWLEDHSTYGTFVNGDRIAGRVELRAGDRVRIGSPGVECELVRVVDDDGAA